MKLNFRILRADDFHFPVFDRPGDQSELIHLEDLSTADGYRRFHALLDRKWASVIDTVRDGSDMLAYFDDDDFWDFQVSARSLLVGGYDGFPKGPKPDTTSVEFKLREIVKYLRQHQYRSHARHRSGDHRGTGK